MRSRISAVYPDSSFVNHNAATIFIADFTRRTKNLRHVEIHSLHPHCPVKPDNLMDCFEISNPSNHNLEFNIFEDNQFKNETGKDIAHCEGCFYPSVNYEDSWVVLLEIKDCSVRNMSLYKKDVVDKIIKTAVIFKREGIITNHKIYGIASFPRRNKTAFNDYIFGDIITATALNKRYGIIFYATNKVGVTKNGFISLL